MKDRILKMLEAKANEKREKALTSLELLMENPVGIGDHSTGDFYNNMASGYQQSPGYQRQIEQGLMGSNNAAAAGGMLGTPYHQEANTQLANDIASQDFEKYLQNVLGIFGQGQKGYEHINDMGYDANKQLADYIAQVLSQKSQNSFAGQAMENQFNQGRTNNIFSGLGSIGSGMIGGWA